MRTQEYSAIPDTKDRNYWQLVESSSKDRSVTFRPIDKDLHRQLLQAQRGKKSAPKATINIGHKYNLGKS